MKRSVLLWVTVVAVVVIAAIAARQTLKEATQKKRATSRQSALRTYSQGFAVGMTRKDVEEQLRAKSTSFTQRCCTEDRSAFTDLVKVGEEDVPWYCSEWPVYVAFEFLATEPQRLPLKPGASDMLKKIALVSNGEGCL